MRSVRILAIFMGLLFTVSSSWAAACELSCDLGGLAGGACHGHEIAGSAIGGGADCGQQMRSGSLMVHRAITAPTCMGAPCQHARGPVEPKLAAHSSQLIYAASALAASTPASSAFDLLPPGEFFASRSSGQPPPRSLDSSPIRTLRI
jgi:hypothetical protein